jgi:hypothetical protein
LRRYSLSRYDRLERPALPQGQSDVAGSGGWWLLFTEISRPLVGLTTIETSRMHSETRALIAPYTAHVALSPDLQPGYYELRLYIGGLWAMSERVGRAVPLEVIPSHHIPSKFELPAKYKVEPQHAEGSAVQYTFSWEHSRSSPSIGLEFVVHFFKQEDDLHSAMVQHELCPAQRRISAVQQLPRLLPATVYWIAVGVRAVVGGGFPSAAADSWRWEALKAFRTHATLLVAAESLRGAMAGVASAHYSMPPLGNGSERACTFEV